VPRPIVSRRRRRRPSRIGPEDSAAGAGARGGLAAAALFAVALVVRLLHWGATPDRAWAYGVGYKGDAALWLEWARALQLDRVFQLGLPLQPPGTAYLVSWLWSGQASGIAALRIAWCGLGALAVAAFYLAARRGFGERVGLGVGVLLAGGTSGLLLSGSVDSETPYLVLVGASFLLHERIAGERRDGRALAGWALLQGLACLFRVEHALYAALAGAWLALGWRRAGVATGEMVRRGALVAAVALAALAPWQLTAWSAVARLNEQAPATSAAEESTFARFEQRLAHVDWTPDAVERRARLPAFTRRQATLFVVATVARRGGTVVRAEDFGILEEAFGSIPGPLPRAFLVSLYGPLNFALAHHDGAAGGFSTARLEVPPPLAGGAARYPPELVAGLPPPQLALVYPPHLALVREGYAIGGRWIAEHPLAWLRLVGRKLALFWSGAALGFGGADLPLGAVGIRRAVDLVVPAPGGLTTFWRLGVLGLAAIGVARGRRTPALAPWLLFLASKLVVVVAFFGYARLGAVVAPVVALLVVLAVAGPEARAATRRHHLVAALAGLLLVGVETARFLDPPALRLDGRAVGASDPFPADTHRDQVLEAVER
jgi:hypothetical protein